MNMVNDIPTQYIQNKGQMDDDSMPSNKNQIKLRMHVKKQESIMKESFELVGIREYLPIMIMRYANTPWNNITISFNLVGRKVVTIKDLYDKMLELCPFKREIYHEEMLIEIEKGEDAVWELKRRSSQLVMPVFTNQPHFLLRINNIKIWNKSGNSFYLTINNFENDIKDGNDLLKRHIENQIDGGPRFGYLLPNRLREYTILTCDQEIFPRKIFTIGSKNDSINHCILDIQWKLYQNCTNETPVNKLNNYNVRDTYLNEQDKGSELVLRQDPAMIKIINKFSKSHTDSILSKIRTNPLQKQRNANIKLCNKERSIDNFKNSRKREKKTFIVPKERVKSLTDLDSIPYIRKFYIKADSSSTLRKGRKGEQKELKSKNMKNNDNKNVKYKNSYQSSINILPLDRRKEKN